MFISVFLLFRLFCISSSQLIHTTTSSLMAFSLHQHDRRDCARGLRYSDGAISHSFLIVFGDACKLFITAKREDIFLFSQIILYLWLMRMKCHCHRQTIFYAWIKSAHKDHLFRNIYRTLWNMGTIPQGPGNAFFTGVAEINTYRYFFFFFSFFLSFFFKSMCIFPSDANIFVWVINLYED